MQETKKNEQLNNINSIKVIFSILEVLNIFSFLVGWAYFIFLAFTSLDLYIVLIFFGYSVLFIINILIIRIFKKGFESISSLFAHLLSKAK
tara:strand:- start:699 stop:971 length:273 start_codon:yes stop_codon:yes gene_type:complete